MPNPNLEKISGFFGEYYGKLLLNDHGDRVKAIIEGKNPAPYEFEVQPAARCNANCRHCFGREYKRCEERLYDEKSMDYVIDQIMNFENDGFGVETIKFCGSTGDPLLNPQTLRAVNKVYGRKYLRLFTNGIELGANKDNQEYLETIAKINNIVVSLDVASTTTLHKTKPGSRRYSGLETDHIFESMAKLVEQGTNVEAGFAITMGNYWETAEFARKISTHGAARKIRYRIDITDPKISEEHSSEINHLLKEARMYADDRLEIISAHSEEQIKSSERESFGSKGCGIKCFTCRFWACLGPDGGVYPCGHIVAADTPNYGNILEKSLDKIWNGKQRMNLIENLPGEKCHLCSPFSLSTNEIFNYLDHSGISGEEFWKIHEDYSQQKENKFQIK